MPVARSYGGLVVTDLVADADLAGAQQMKPATIRSVVVLPQPDGPSSHQLAVLDLEREVAAASAAP